MADVKWIKFSTDMFNDEKILLIEQMPDGDALIVIWCKLLCLAGRVNDGGYIHIGQNLPYTDEMFAGIFHRPVNTIRLALEVFLRFGMVENTDKGLYLTNWCEYQNVAGMELQREKARLRAANSRAKSKMLLDSTRDVRARSPHVSILDSREKIVESREESITTTPPPSKGEARTHYADRVLLTEKEHSTLEAEYGADQTAEAIKYLDVYKGSTGRVYKSDYLTIRRWVFRAIQEEKAKAARLGIPPTIASAPMPTVKRYKAMREHRNESGRMAMEVAPGYFMTEALAREWAGPNGIVSEAEVQANV